MKKNIIDIIIIGRNEALTLEKTILSSIKALKNLKEKKSLDGKITYVDSHSTDNSIEIAKKHYIDIITTNPCFFTPAHARNTGIYQTKAPYIMFLDGDMELYDNWLIDGISFLEDKKNVAGVGGIRDDRYKEDSGQWKELNNFYNVNQSSSIIKNKVGGAFLYKRPPPLLEVGGFEPENIEEEFFLYLCLVEKNYTLYRINKPMMIHWDIKSSNYVNALKRYKSYGFGLFNGVFLRYATSNLFLLKKVCSFYSETIIYGVLILLLSIYLALFKLALFTPLYIQICATLTYFIYFLYLLSIKKNIKRTILSLIVQNLYLTTYLIGFILNYPKVKFNYRKSTEYKKVVLSNQ